MPGTLAVARVSRGIFLLVGSELGRRAVLPSGAPSP